MIYDKVKRILAQYLEIDEGLISWDTNILEDLGADSLDLVELIMALEDEYSIIITDGSSGELRTVRELVDFIESKLA